MELTSERTEVLWRLAEAPEFSISESGTSEPSFQVFRAFSGVITGSNQIVVANTGSNHLLYLGETGKVLSLVGKEGAGPGEFIGLREAFLAAEGDGVWAWDSRQWRASFFSGSGEYRTALSLATTRMEVPRGFLEGGSVITAELRPSEESIGHPRRYRIRDADGEFVREISGPLEPPARSLVFDAELRSGRRGSMTISVSAGCVGGVEDVVVGSELFTVDARTGVVSAFDANGEVREVYRARSRLPISGAVREALIAWIQGVSIQPPADSLESFLRRMGDVGDPLPAWQGVVPDASGSLWLELPRCHMPGPASFQVIDIEGRDIARVEIPEDMRVLAVRGDRVLVVRTDEFRLEYIELYRVVPV